MEPLTVEEYIQTDDILYDDEIKKENNSPEEATTPEVPLEIKPIPINIKAESDRERVDVIKVEKPEFPGGVKCEEYEVKTMGINRDKVFPGIWPSVWEDGTRRSAFQPYKAATVLTNLQRGNIQTKTPLSDCSGFSWYEKAGRGDLTQKDVDKVHDIDAIDINGLSALMWGAAYGQNNAVLLLLENGADVHLRGKRCETAMHLAAAGGHQEVIKHLIAFGADPDVLDDDGNTPLIYAVHGDHPHAVQELLQEGASMFDPDCYNYAVIKECIQALFVMENHLMNVLRGDSS